MLPRICMFSQSQTSISGKDWCKLVTYILVNFYILYQLFFLYFSYLYPLITFILISWQLQLAILTKSPQKMCRFTQIPQTTVRTGRLYNQSSKEYHNVSVYADITDYSSNRSFSQSISNKYHSPTLNSERNKLLYTEKILQQNRHVQRAVGILLHLNGYFDEDSSSYPRQNPR